MTAKFADFKTDRRFPNVKYYTDLNFGRYKGQDMMFYEFPEGRSPSFGGILDIPGIYKYMLRHGDDGDFITPVSIEKNVVVNYAGIVFTSKELDLGEDGCIILDDEEEAMEICGYDQGQISPYEYVNLVYKDKKLEFEIILEDRP